MTGRAVVSLCSGIGGIDLGLERAGWTIAAQVEIDPYCQQVLTRHWPEVPRWDDLTTLDPATLPPADLVAAGFPCQPVSLAGRRQAQADQRWLWPDVARVVGHLRPRWVLLENVSGLYSRGLGDVLGDLAALGYDAEWACISAADVGAPHRRERVWIVAYPARDGDGRARVGAEPVGTGGGGAERQPALGAQGRAVADAGRAGRRQDPRGTSGDEGADARRAAADDHQPGSHGQGGDAAVADPSGCGRGEGWPEPARRVGEPALAGGGEPVGDANHGGRPERPRPHHGGRNPESPNSAWRVAESILGGVLDGLPGRVDGHRWPAGPGQSQHDWEPPRTVGRGVPQRAKRVSALGNAVVPQIPELIGRAILAADIEGRGVA